MKKFGFISRVSLHTLLTLSILSVYIILLIINRDFILVAAVTVLLISVIGNTLLHQKSGKLRMDIFIEYLIVLLIGLLLIIGSSR